MFAVNEHVMYRFVKKAKIKQIHYDNCPELYYTIIYYNCNKEIQTTGRYLFTKEKSSLTKDCDVIYIKEYDAYIQDIRQEDNKCLILYNNKQKYVSIDKIYKI